ncbi:ABC transporter ATP-binding protein [Ruminococcus sp. FC2018]|uniref:ABC transporter ATP-binding protein n=1 Tax=Ruminococcus sp. FC2018 TaxID=1410617 RepID=UPI0004920417|nr:ABC transporter ATP-binding protein [Ruminococcus sp. FC2018]
MGKLLKYLSRYKLQCLAVLLLLVVQALCDLALPDYTADIVDTGIMQKGVDRPSPKVISQQTLDDIKVFMTDDEQKLTQECYQLIDSIKDTDIVPLKDSVPKGKVYKLTTDDSKKLDELDKAMQTTVAVYSFASRTKLENAPQGEGENPGNAEKMAPGAAEIANDKTMLDMVKMGGTGLKFREDFSKKMDEMSQMTVEQSAKAFVQGEYDKLGVDLNSLEKSYLWKAGLKMLGMAGIIMLCTILVGFLAARIGAGIGLDLRKGVFKKVISFSNQEMDSFSTSSLITRSTNDIQQIQMVLTIMLRMCLYAPILGIGGMIRVLNTNSGMTWIIGIAVLAVSLLIGLLMFIAMPKFKIMQKKVDNLNLVTREILTGLPVIRAFSREKHEEKRFDGSNSDLTKTMLFTHRTMSFMFPAMTLVMNGVSILIVWIAAKQIDLGKLQVGSMTAFITYAMMIIMSFLMLTMISVFLPRAAVAAERVDEVLSSEGTIKDKEDADPNKKITQGVVKFDHVNFRYNNADADVLEDIDFTAQEGKTTAIIGSTGSGKSTLVHLIPRFYDVTAGKITIDGVDVRDYTQKNLRDAIGFVPQKGVLFSGDIDSNLAFGCPDAPHEQLEKAAEIAQATEFITAKPDGFKSEISQGGTNVSGGQKQRLSIARAVAKKPKVLIFDDSFSALDFKTDVALRKALGENVKDATIIIVAQRIVTIMNADEIIVLDDGKIAGKGTHLELIGACDVYDQIVKSQLSEEEYNKQLALAGRKGGD